MGGRVIADAIELTGADGIFFEGSSSNTFETQLVVTNPSQDNVITLPDNTGTVALTSQLGGGAGADTGINAGNLLAVASGGLSNDDFLRIDGTSVEGLTVAETVTALGVLQNISEDASPQLGANLDLNSSDITGTGNINITGNISLSGTVDGVDIAALNTTVGNINTDLVNDTSP